MTTLTIRDSRVHCGGYQWALGSTTGTHISHRRPEPKDWWRKHAMDQMWEDRRYRLCRIPRRLRKAAKMAVR